MMKHERTDLVDQIMSRGLFSSLDRHGTMAILVPRDHTIPMARDLFLAGYPCGNSLTPTQDPNTPFRHVVTVVPDEQATHDIVYYYPSHDTFDVQPAYSTTRDTSGGQGVVKLRAESH